MMDSERQLLKIIIVDLDGVLWMGKCIEVGDKIMPNQGIITALKEMNNRGVLVCCISKNNPMYVEPILKHLGIFELFIIRQINWKPKSANLQEILDLLDLTDNGVVFVDDDEFERDEVKDKFPNILAISPDEWDLIDSTFKIKESNPEAALKRHEYYAMHIARKTDEKYSGLKREEFLNTLNITINIRRMKDTDIARISELFERAHKLNYSGQRKRTEELEEFIQNPNIDMFSFEISDRYGSYGESAGICIIDKNFPVLKITDLVLTCRVQGRNIELAILHYLARQYSMIGFNKMCIDFHKTDYNSHLTYGLASLGFRIKKTNIYTGPQYELALPKELACNIDYINIKFDTGSIGGPAKVPFVQDFVKQVFSKYHVRGPILIVGSGIGEVLGVDFIPWLKCSYEDIEIMKLDILQFGDTDIIADAENMPTIPSGSQGLVLCIDVLEHVGEFWRAAQELSRITKIGGIIIATVPMNIGVHGAGADLWRMTPMGLRYLFNKIIDGVMFRELELSIEGDPGYPIRSAIAVEKLDVKGSLTWEESQK